MNYHRLIAFTLLVVVLGLAACERLHYTVRVSPAAADPRAFQRELTVQTGSDLGSDGGLDPEETARIAALFGTSPKDSGASPKTMKVTGTFDHIPQDFRGGGYYGYLSSDLGSVRFYVEQFRGNYSLTRRIEQQHQACRLAGEILATTIEQQFAATAGVERLATMLRTQVPEDLSDLLLMLRMELAADEPVLRTGTRTPDGIPSKSARTRLAARVTQFLIERNYLRADKGATLFANLFCLATAPDMGTETSNRLLLQVIDLFLERCALPDAKPLREAILDRWYNQENKTDVLFADLETASKTPTAKALIESAAAEVLGKLSERPRPAPTESHAMLAFSTFFDLLPQSVSFDSLDLTVQMPGELVFANQQRPGDAPGVQVSNSGARWAVRVPVEYGAASILPPTAIAVWASPDAEFQSKNLGNVRINSEDLFAYCTMFSELSPSEREDWTHRAASGIFKQVSENDPSTPISLQGLSPAQVDLAVTLFPAHERQPKK